MYIFERLTAAAFLEVLSKTFLQAVSDATTCSKLRASYRLFREGASVTPFLLHQGSFPKKAHMVTQFPDTMSIQRANIQGSGEA